MMKPDKKLSFFDTAKNRTRFRKGFYICLCILLFVDILAWFLFERHGHFPWEEVPFFNAVYGFIACVALIFIAKILRAIVKRKEGYYD